MQLLQARSLSASAVKRSSRCGSASSLPRAPVQKRLVRVSAEPDYTTTTTSTSTTTTGTATGDEQLAKFQAQANDALDFVKSKWDATDNSEKPAAIAIIIGVVVAQIAIGATIDAVDKIPIVNKGLQLIGVAVTTLFLYRYFTDPAERDNVKKSVDAFVKSVTGDK